MLKFGWGEEKFVFTKPISLAGQFAERISEYEEKPLTVTALAIADGNEQTVICSVDLASLSYPFLEIIREALKKENIEGLDIDKIVIGAIHTHTGPVYKGRASRRATMLGIKSGRQIIEAELPAGRKYVEKAPVSQNTDITTPEEAADEIVAKVVKAIKTAWLNCKAGSYSTAFGRAVVGLCRRATYNDG